VCDYSCTKALQLRRADLAAEVAGAGPPAGAARAVRDSLAEELGTLGGSLATAAAMAEESDLKLSLWTTERDRTCAKAGRRQQFGTREARDAWIAEEVGRTCGQAEEKRRQLVKLGEHVASLGQELQQAGAAEEQAAAERARLEGANHKRKELLQERAALRGRLGESGAELAGLRDRLVREETARVQLGRLRALAGPKVLRGWESVQAVLAEVPELRDSYHGMVIQNFTCPEQMVAAVEETAGNRLFNHVVSTDVAATGILKEVNRCRLSGSSRTACPFV
jgi:structural maintenance of chromosome 3 (chondroitin sulfate proteoglycan 6)